ncbi:hypothetical protein [Kitasatospora sp. NPDC057015]|uniref:hypothetical protein n=1 Tax=Kitasatospora sp. NPDC057015 TaxID=3346001 RepID=UPI003636191F
MPHRAPTARPPVADPKIPLLPFDTQHWTDFERLVCELVEATEGLTRVARYGTAGQAQGGIDVVGLASDGRWSAFQVKHVVEFPAASARKAFDRFVRGSRPHRATRFVIVTSCRGTSTRVRELALEYRAEFPELLLGEVWDAEHLGRLLRPLPWIVARYFGDPVALRFCDAHALAEYYGGPDGRTGTSEGAVGMPVTDADPFDLEVHQAIHAEGDAPVAPLPPYLRRPFDDELNTVLDGAVRGTSGTAVLLGDSSTGKTRALWEAIRGLPDEWRLWHPPSPDTLLGCVRSVGPRTVLWLNEINRYLLTGDADRDERVAAALNELLRDPGRAPVLVLGTSWHAYQRPMTTAAGSTDENAERRALLAHRWIPVPSRFTADEVAALLTVPDLSDHRLRQAARSAEGRHITQYLAGGPALQERYANASPTARAVLEAAMDARRLGHGLELAAGFLAEAATDYLTDLELDLAPEHWFEEALRYHSEPCRGVRGPLSTVRGTGGGGLRLADFLEQDARRTRNLHCPGGAFWRAAERHASTADRATLVVAAAARGRISDAESLARSTADTDGGSALNALARHLEQRHGDVDAAPYYALAAGAGHAGAQVRLAWQLEQDGNLDEAEAWYRRAVGSDVGPDATVGLASVLWERGDRSAALDLYNEALAAGGARSIEYQARWLAKKGRHRLALALTGCAFRAGNTEAFTGLAWTYMSPEEKPRAIDVLKHAYHVEGDVNAPRELAWVLAEDGDRAGSAEYADIAVALGEPNVLRGLGMKHAAQGDHRAAAGLYWRAYNRELYSVLLDLALLREEQGDLRRAERLYRRALDEGQSYAAHGLVRVLELSGQGRAAEELANRSYDTVETLARIRAAHGRRESAELLLRTLVAKGRADALLTLGAVRREAGDRAGAELALRQAVDAGVPRAARELAALQADPQDAAH